MEGGQGSARNAGKKPGEQNAGIEAGQPVMVSLSAKSTKLRETRLNFWLWTKRLASPADPRVREVRGASEKRRMLRGRRHAFVSGRLYCAGRNVSAYSIEGQRQRMKPYGNTKTKQPRD